MEGYSCSGLSTSFNSYNLEVNSTCYFLSRPSDLIGVFLKEPSVVPTH